MRLLLDTNVLGKVCHPRKHADVREWFRRAALVHEVPLSDVVDYELRRALLHIDSRRSLAVLDMLPTFARRVPVTAATWRAAAELWADMRRMGRSTGTEADLDADLLLAVQARAEAATIVTSNLRHFEGIAKAADWSDVPL